MLRSHGVVSICLALAIFGPAAAVAQQRPTSSRLLRSVLPENGKVTAQAPSATSAPVRVAPTTPTRTIEVDPRSITPRRGGTAATIESSRLGSKVARPAPARPRPPSRAQDVAAALARLGARPPFDLSGSGRYAVAAQRKGDGLVLIDLARRKRLRQLEKSKRRYVLVEISADARWIAAVLGQDSDRIDLWRADNGRLIAVLKAPGGAKRKLEFSARGNQLRVTLQNGGELLFSVPAGKLIGGVGAAGRGAAEQPRVQARQLTPRVGTVPKSEDSKGQTPSAPLMVHPQDEARARREAESSAAPRVAAPTPAKPTVRPEATVPAEPKTAVKAAPKTSAPITAAPKRAAKKRLAPPPAAAPRMAAPAPGVAAPEPRMAQPEPRMAAPEPRMAAPAPRAMTSDVDSEAAPPPAAAAAPRAFEHIDGAVGETSAPEAAAEPLAPAEEAADSTPHAFAADTLPETAAESAADADAAAAAESPAAPGDSTFAEGVESAAETAAAEQDEEPSSVTVHFATNRNRLAPKDREWVVYFRRFFSTLPAFVIYGLVALALLVFPWFGKRSWAAYAVFTGAVVLCAMATLEAYVRSQLRDELSGELYGSAVTDLSYGMCEVSVPLPENRQAGELNRPVSVWVFQAPENPEKHFMLRRVEEHANKEAFYKSLSAHLAEADIPAALLFIHGYNVSFEDAIFRTAQLAVDLKFPGAAVTFSWPSYADPVKYTFDEQHAEVSIPAFREFLKDMAAKSGAEQIHVIAHSMGNRVLAGALEQMDPESREINRKVIHEIVLAAPDIDRRVFESQVLPHIDENSQHCTLYASSRDRALLISRYFHNYQRLGETEPELIVANGMDTIDASFVDTSLLGHSYIGDVQSIVSDLHHLLVDGKRPPERLGLESLMRGTLMYWTIRPQLQTATDSSLRR